ncbi:hypothetical protein TTHERM_000031619 (macronuclear) [Tetrahymena thermophila SB210]|uniref:Uncharacterized protein n=1 Tax=Tetrahymena thermophila (strain SB210) TaxID=312017 RepID=W7XKF5_TETTS|nr:hypothetical protein TTHERM_000031619 [Tetrahymena thermophila SB210]EWS74854.1 hypothetical protein TTHERM_000031619 [Tetrahymena thermophila SB210]|eukprot:XP_012652567.1 hypothetical protein TTHERM_000031619 [Tetrahymena thermophila SB210]
MNQNKHNKRQKKLQKQKSIKMITKICQMIFIKTYKTPPTNKCLNRFCINKWEQIIMNKNLEFMILILQKNFQDISLIITYQQFVSDLNRIQFKKICLRGIFKTTLKKSFKNQNSKVQVGYTLYW